MSAESLPDNLLYVSRSTSSALSKLIVVSNRLPLAFRADTTGAKTPVLSPGGLVAALAPALSGTGAAWVGWDGTDSSGEDSLDLGGFVLHPVSLSQALIEQHYEGFSNSTLWPLFHDVGVKPDFSRAWWDAYVAVNTMFADRVSSLLAPGGTVFVQDYQLMLLPALLRRRRADARIGYFHHIPFPPRERLSTLNHAQEILEGLWASDLIGFQRATDCENFRDAAVRASLVAGSTPQPHVSVYPISIDTPSVGAAASSATVTAKAHAFREGWGQPGTVFLGVDRLDYTKGIPHRLKAYEELLASGTVNADDVVFVQAASPSRENVASYQALSEEIDGLVAHINHTYIPANGRDAVIYLRENLAREDMLALFVAADVMVVTSLADGMNLVAKEFVACRAEDSGVLILSVHAGAAEHMPEALLVDPYDISAIAHAMQESLLLGAKDIARRMARLRSEVSTHDVSAWVDGILGDLARREN